MNMQTFKSVLLDCPEANEYESNLTKGERYLMTNVFVPFYRDEEQTTTENLDFSAFSIDELSYVYNNIEKFDSWFQILSGHMAMIDFLVKAEPYISKTVFI